MKATQVTTSVLERWVIAVVSALLTGLIVVWAWNASELVMQFVFLLAAFALVLLAVLCCAAWRYGFRWFFSRRALRFYGWLAVGIVSVIVLFYAEESWRGKRMWAALQREVAARGESLELSSVIPLAVPPEENFALAPGMPKLLGYAKGKARSKADSNPENLPFYLGRGRPDYPESANWALGQMTDLAMWQMYFRNHPLTNTEPANTAVRQLAFPVAAAPQTPAADVMLALSRYDAALEVLREASQRPKARYPLAYEEGVFALVWPSSFAVPDFPAAAQVLCLRAVAELEQNQSGAALRDIMVALRLADSLRAQPYSLLHHTRAEMLMFCLQPVWEGLAHHRWSSEQLAALQRQFAGMDLLAEFRVAVRGETFMFMNLADQIQAFFEDRRSTAGDQLQKEGAPFFLWLVRTFYPRGWLYQDKVWMYRFYERRADVFKAMDTANTGKGDAELRRATDPFLVTFVVPKFRQTFHESMEDALLLETACQEAVVACALERYRLAQGQYPDALEALSPAWLKELPLDLVDPKGGKLRYHLEEDGGFVLYSIGLNREDDRGKPGPAYEDWRRRQATFPRLDEGDWVWRQPGR